MKPIEFFEAEIHPKGAFTALVMGLEILIRTESSN